MTALLANAAMGQTSLNYDQCKRVIDQRALNDNNNGGDRSFSSNREGSQRRTYGNLCTGSTFYSPLGNTNQQGTGTIPSRVGDPFRRFCDLIDRFPNVFNLMATGNSPHTVFAPTDAAFAKIDGLIGRLDEQRMLELHILPQARLTRDLRCGQTYRTINTQQDRRNRQRSKTRCINASRAQQVGPGNMHNGLNPTIGVPDNIFNAQQFEFQTEFVLNFDNAGDTDEKTEYTFSQDVIACNGVIHVVDEIILPGPRNGSWNTGRQYYGSKAYNYYGTKGNNRGNRGNGYYTSGNRGYNYYYNKAGKGGKGYKGSKGNGFAGKGNGNNNYGRGNEYYNYGTGWRTRNLEGAVDGDDLDFEEPDELYMSDAEFFGVEGLIERPDELESVEEQEREAELENRKHRLEAMLEPDGKIIQV